MESINHLKSSKNTMKHQIRAPKMDMFESVNTYYLRISIPGVKKENVKLTISDTNRLEIKGNVNTIVNSEFEKSLFREIYEGPFIRSIDLPQNADSSKVVFSYQGGILEVTIPKINV